jgi:hypothetical protein
MVLFLFMMKAKGRTLPLVPSVVPRWKTLFAFRNSKAVLMTNLLDQSFDIAFG